MVIKEKRKEEKKKDYAEYLEELHHLKLV